MDHRISKDMISSGLTPSGEKNQADLGKTQYGSAPSPSKLMDAYKSMYNKKDEVINEHHKKDVDGNTIPHEGEELNEGKIPAGLQAYLDKKKGKKEDKKEVKEEMDLFDVISTHFINEGYEEKDVYKAMSTLTEDQLQNLDEALPAIGAVLAAIPALAGKLATGAAVGGKMALGAGAKGLAAAKVAAKGGLMATKGAVKGAVSAGKNVMTGAKGLADKALTKVQNIAKPAPKITSSGGDIVQGSDSGNTIKKFLKRETGNVVRQELLKDRPGTNKTSKAGFATAEKINASADLFDIVKGQLLDEGLTEEEIRDIMLTLTPDEIMSEMAVNPNIAAMDAKNRADMIARAQANKVPDKVKEASKRQMKAGTPREDPKNPYTTQDKKTIIDYNKDK